MADRDLGGGVAHDRPRAVKRLQAQRRQELLARRNLPWFTIVVDENGSRDIMRPRQNSGRDLIFTTQSEIIALMTLLGAIIV